MPDDDPGPDDGHRNAGRSEQLLDRSATAQVGRQVVVVVAKTAKVDDAPQPGPRGRVAERHGGGGILALEVRVVERMDKVEGRLTAAQRGAQGGGVVNIPVDRPPRAG